MASGLAVPRFKPDRPDRYRAALARHGQDTIAGVPVPDWSPQLHEEFMCSWQIETSVAALKAGACGYVLKSVADRDLVEACRAAMRGEPYIYPAAVQALVRSFLERARNGEEVAADPLTPRESEIVKLVAEGYTTREIADTLVISEKTVERHRASVLEKLGMRDRVDVTRYAIRRGLVEP
jgi:DNA-binding NarL/FixJ family response regulator